MDLWLPNNIETGIISNQPLDNNSAKWTYVEQV